MTGNEYAQTGMCVTHAYVTEARKRSSSPAAFPLIPTSFGISDASSTMGDQPVGEQVANSAEKPAPSSRKNSILVTDPASGGARSATAQHHPHFVDNLLPHRSPPNQPGGASASSTNLDSLHQGSVSGPTTPAHPGPHTTPVPSTNPGPRTASHAPPHGGTHAGPQFGPLGGPGGRSMSPGTTDSEAEPQASAVPGATQPAVTGRSTSKQPSDPRIPMDDGKIHILVGVTGSLYISSVRHILAKLQSIYGDRVAIQVILTTAADKILHRSDVASNVQFWHDNDEWETWHGRNDPVIHIELRRWADILLIAPLSANTLGKIAMGLCDNLLTNVVRAWNAQYPILVAPAMVSYAYNHPATKAHMRIIREEMKWIEILRPTEKVAGSTGGIGMGGMMAWPEIVDRVVQHLGGYPDDNDDDEDDDDDNAQRLSGNEEDDDDDDDEEDSTEKFEDAAETA